MLVECDACHDSQPDTVTGGPHGMHPLGQVWVDAHGDVVENTNAKQCQVCHGTDYSGTVLSHMQSDRDLDFEGTSLAFFRGQRVGCYSCHLGPSDDNANPNHRPTATDGSVSTVDQPVAINLVASDSDHDPLALRIVKQPGFGRVALSGTTATYLPDPGFAGVDDFTFAAWDGQVDSNLATVSVTRGATWGNYGAGYPGTNDLIPTIGMTANPVLGSDVTMQVQNTAGIPSVMIVLASTELAAIETRNGGVLLAELDLLFAAPLPVGGANVDWSVPNDSALVGLSLYTQAIEADPGARYRVAFTPGLRLTLGN
jgi:hypothetical protein